MGEIYGGLMLFERDDAADVLRYFRGFIADAPREYGGFPAWHLAPPLPFVPEDRVGEPFLTGVRRWTGDHHEGAGVLQRFRDVAQPVAEHVGPMPYPALNAAFDALSGAGCSTTGRRCSSRTSPTRRSRRISKTGRAYRRSTPPCTCTR